MPNEVVFLGRRVAAVLACAGVCRRVRKLSGFPRARNCQIVSARGPPSGWGHDVSVAQADEPADKAVRP